MKKSDFLYDSDSGNQDTGESNDDDVIPHSQYSSEEEFLIVLKQRLKKNEWS